MSPSSLIAAEPVVAPIPRFGQALHRALSEADHRSLRELALRLTRTDEHRMPDEPAARDD
ncbi:hypothetical protein [Roseisolibacter agri]|uniref:Uncharacterized protein n=1 Tax=Roseisolibacter agri TaxID=2014610 RepID=A0AA37Q4B6_9BACT|nr:hypothetical protein [Roseisolibacter agri]GLC26330.1 hypothetical protein rosag_28430 [Roseisolibacter agri]